MNKSIKFIFIFLSILFFIFIGYEYPIIIDNTKKYVKYSLKKIGVINTFVSKHNDLKKVEKEKRDGLDNQINNIEGNSYNLEYEKIINFDGRTANFFIEKKDNPELFFDIFLQNGINLKDKDAFEINLPLDIFLEKNGGVKSILNINGKKYALISNKNNINCYYASIVNLESGKKIFSTKCLPDFDKTDFNGLGGAYIEDEKNIFLSIGSPEWNSKKIRNLAQDTESIYGKIIRLDKKSFVKDEIKSTDYDIFSIGHKNPQGMVLVQDKIFSVEHGPQGGDEINLIIENNNYGWPIVSYGTRYNNGKGFKKNIKKFNNPIFTFLPSVAPSSINKCPKNLQNYYTNNYCLLMLTLRGMSIYVILIDKEKLNLISLEQFKIGQRLRHFGLNKSNEIFQMNDFFYISVDGEGIYKMIFKDLR